MKQLEPNLFVSGQIAPEDIPALAAAGVTMIVNNRPDGEVRGQPEGGLIASAAREAGIDYRTIQISQLTGDAVDDTARLLADADGKGATLLAFCASGTRSTYLWALARSSQGRDADALVQAAAEAGYDLTPIRRFLR